MKVHLFGATSSPGCAIYGLKYLANQEREMYPAGAQFISHDFYVDDGLVSVESAEQAVDLIQEDPRDLQEGWPLFAQVCLKRSLSNRISTTERKSN